MAHPKEPQSFMSLQEALRARSTHFAAFAQGNWQSVSDPEALLLLQPHTAAESLCSLLATSEPIEMVQVSLGNILSACPDHDNPKHNPLPAVPGLTPTQAGRTVPKRHAQSHRHHSSPTSWLPREQRLVAEPVSQPASLPLNKAAFPAATSLSGHQS